MQLGQSLLTLGIVPAVWLSGYVMLMRASRGIRLPMAPSVTVSLAPAISIPFWSLGMAVSAYIGMFRPVVWGCLGWLVSIPLLLALRRGPQQVGARQHLSRRLVLGALLVTSFGLYAAFPHDSFFVGRDQAAYANQALHLDRDGALKLDWPVRVDDPNLWGFVARSYNATGVYPKTDDLEVQFAPVFPLWLAMAFSGLGVVGLQGFNALVSALSAAVFFGVASRLMVRRVALAAAALFALNPMQIWISRVTLSEVLAQYLLLSGVLLLFLARPRNPERFWVLGGFLLGASVLVRIDSFVIAPIAAGFGWLASAFQRAPSERSPAREEAARRERRGTNMGTLVLLAVLLLGVPFYWLTTETYFMSQARKLLPLGAASILLGLVWWTQVGASRVRALARWRAFWIGLAVVVALLGIFAYFIRPRWEPFAHYGNPTQVLFGSRDFREESFVNLGAYVTPAVAFAALAGFMLWLRRAVLGPFRPALLMTLLLWGGYSLLYLYQPSISPDQPWGMRRFVGLVIPGVVLLAAGVLARARWRLRWHLPATILLTAAVIAYPNFRARAVLFVREYDGAYAYVSSIANRVPSGSLLLAQVTSRLFGHLALGRGLKTIRFNYGDAERLRAAQAVLASNVAPGEPYYVLTEEPHLLGDEKPIETFSATFTWLRERNTAPADKTRTSDFRFYLFERRGPLNEPWAYLADLGLSTIAGVKEGGFWPVEETEGGRTRWTKANAWLEIPIKKGWTPRSLGLDIVDAPPSGTRLTVRANGAEIHDGPLPRVPVSLSLELPKDLKKRLKVELASDTFRPSDGGRSTDQRQLGIRFKALTLR